MNTLIDKIQGEMETDDVNRNRQSAYLVECYNESDKKTKEQIDSCFIALCGWSLKTLINKVEV